MRKWERWEVLVNSPKTIGKLLLTGKYDFEFDLMLLVPRFNEQNC